MDFSRSGLEKAGFRGFVSLARLEPTAVPTHGGVYAVIREGDDDPVLLADSVGGHFKGKNPTVERSVLERKWVAGCTVVYIGKATSLRSRLRQYRDFGCGKPVGHWGGRYIWQLEDCSDLLVAWRSEVEPRDAERALLADFTARYGRLPFANIAG